MVSQYNQVSGENPVTVEEIQRGEFQWKTGACLDSLWKSIVPLESAITAFYFCTTVPSSTKRLVVDKSMEMERFNEELVLLQREMMSFLKFYKDGFLASINEQQCALRSALDGINYIPYSAYLF